MARVINMTSPKGVELKTQNTYCEENIQVIPTFNIPQKASIQYGANNEFELVLGGVYNGQEESIVLGELDTTADYKFYKTTNVNFRTNYIDNVKIPLSLEIKTAVNLQNKTITPTKTQQTIYADSEYDGLEKIIINAVPLQEKRVTSNGTITPDVGYLGLSSVIVDVAETIGVLQEKTITPTKSTQTVEPSYGYDGLSKVTVEPIPDSYIEPTGTKEITANGTDIYVAQYAYVNVNVKQPSGNLTINTLIGTTGVFDVTWYETVTFGINVYAGAYEVLS